MGRNQSIEVVGDNLKLLRLLNFCGKKNENAYFKCSLCLQFTTGFSLKQPKLNFVPAFMHTDNVSDECSTQRYILFLRCDKLHEMNTARGKRRAYMQWTGVFVKYTNVGRSKCLCIT